MGVRRNGRGLARAGSAVMMAVTSLGVAGVTQAAEPPVTRIAGEDRIDTAAKVMVDGRFFGDVAVVTRSDVYADALAATPLASALEAPILVTPPTSLDERVADRLELSGVEGVIIVGGEKAVSPAVGQAIADQGIEVVQIGGDSRFETALVVAEVVMAERQVDTLPVMVATGTTFPDALAAGAGAAQQDGVVVLSQGRTLDPDTAAFITEVSSQTTAVGGPAVAAVNAAGITARPVAGADRYETASALAAFTHPSATTAVVVSGETFADSLAGGALAALRDAPLLLTGKNALPPSTRGYLSAHTSSATIVGGTAVVTAGVEAEIASSMTPAPTPADGPSTPSAP